MNQPIYITPEMLKKIAADVAQILLNTPSVWGDFSRVHIHADAKVQNALINTNSGHVYVEQFVICGHNVCLLTGTHDMSKTGLARQNFPTKGHDIIIKSGAWLASNVTVLGPATIGENSVIAAGSVVIGDVKANSLYAGVPAKFIRSIEGLDTSIVTDTQDCQT